MRFLLLSIALLTTFGCKTTKQTYDAVKYDTNANLSRSDYKDVLLKPRGKEEGDTEEEQKPIFATDLKFEQMLMAPPKPKIANSKLITLSVTEEVPIRDVIVELARIASVEVEISPEVYGNVILMVKDRPFQDVLDSIASLTDLKITVNNGILKVTLDKPYVVNYDLKFLNSVRSNSSSLSISTSTGADEMSTGGKTSISSSSSGDLWTAVTANIEKIIGVDNAIGGVLKPFVTLNQQAGIVTVKANERDHKIVKEYIDEVRSSSTAQVLIEAKIIEVDLTDEFRTGIDWSEISSVSNASFTDYASGDSSSTTFTNPFVVVIILFLRLLLCLRSSVRHELCQVRALQR
jgi:type II secretory pathway component GspD/PulD (secretin)